MKYDSDYAYDMIMPQPPPPPPPKKKKKEKKRKDNSNKKGVTIDEALATLKLYNYVGFARQTAK